MTKSAAARRIQAAWRGWRLARHGAHLRELARVRRATVGTATKLYEAMGLLGDGSISHRQLLEVQEMAMQALLQLDR
jgi:hypothetical protein